jgi:hypothetical protein
MTFGYNMHFIWYKNKDKCTCNRVIKMSYMKDNFAYWPYM